MTAHRQKPTITPERVQWFADYYKQNPVWGVFHASLDDGNLCGASTGDLFDTTTMRWVPGGRASWPADVREAAAWFDTLTPSQRKRLAMKAEDLANSIRRSA